MKLAGEDYMGDIYEGYIPGALEELANDGETILTIDKVGPTL